MANTITTKTEFDIFISYSRRNKAFVQTLWETLKTHQYTTWVDWEDIPPVSPWRQEIESGIVSSHNFLFVLSADSLASVECQKEIECAVAYNKRLVPIVIGEVDVKTVLPAIADLNWIFFCNSDQDFDTALQKLLHALETDLDYARVHTRLLARTYDWLEHEREPSYLLRGAELKKIDHWIIQEEERTPTLTAEQRDFVVTSQQAEAEHQRLLIRNQRRRLMATGIGLAIMAILASVAEINRRAAVNRELAALSTAANAEYAVGNFPAALLNSLKAGVRLKQSLWVKRNAGLRKTVVSSLGQAFYQIKEFNQFHNPQGWMETVSFSPDGAALAMGGQGGSLQLWHPGSPKAESLIAHGDGVLATAFSDDSQYLVSGDISGHIYLWQRQGNTWTPIHQWQQETPVRTLAMSSDPGFIIVAGDDGQIRLWDQTGQQQKAWQAHQGRVRKISRTSNDHIISIGEDNRIAMWTLDGILIRNWSVEEGVIYTVAITPDGQRIATGDNNGRIRLWDWQGKPLTDWQGHQEKAIQDIEFAADGQQIITAGDDYSVMIWDSEGNLKGRLRGHQNWVNDVSVNPMGDVIASVSNDHTARVWRPKKQVPTELYHSDEIYRAAYVSDKKLLATAGASGEINLWQQASEWQRVDQLQGHSDRINSLAVSADNQYLASGSSDQTVRLWPMDGRQSQTLQLDNLVLSVVFSPDGQSLFSSDFDNKVIQWRTDGTRVREWELDNVIYAMRHSPDGEMMALAGEDGKIRIWDAEGKAITSFKVADSAVYDLAFTVDGRQIVSGGSDGYVRLHSLDGTLVKQWHHDQQVWTVAVAPEGGSIASGGANRQVKLWSRQTGDQPLVSFSGHQSDVENLVFLDDGQLISTSSDRKVILWDLSILNLNSLVEKTCNWWGDYLPTAHGLTPAERQLCQ